jgi:hypothetical protein
MFGYQIQGKAATQISTVTPKRTKGAIIDERFNHGDRLPITSQMCFQEIFLVILIIPLGTNRHLRHQTQGLGTKSNDH